MLHYTRQASPYRDGLFPTTSAVAPAAAATSGRYRATPSCHRPSPHHARSTPSPYGRVPHPYNVPAGSAVNWPGERLPTHSPTTPEHSHYRQKGSPRVSPSDVPHRVVASAHAHHHSHSCHSDSRCLVGGACREAGQGDDREEGRRRCNAQPDTQGRRKGKDSPPHEHRRRRHSSSRHTKRKTSAQRCPCDCEGRRQSAAPHTDIVDHFPAAPSVKDTSPIRGFFRRLEREAAHALDAMPDASIASSSSAPSECACAGHTGGRRPSSRPTRSSQAATANTLELYRTLLLQAMTESAAWEDRTHALEAAVAAHQERERRMARQLQRARQALTVLAAYAEGAGCAAAATRAPQPEREGHMATAFNAPSSSSSLSSPSPSPQRHATVDQMCCDAVESGMGVSAAAASRLSPAPRRLFSHSAVSELIHGSLGRSLELACRSPAACSSEAEAEDEEESAAGSEEAALPAKARYGPRWRSIGDDDAELVTPPSLFAQSRAGEAPAQPAPAMAYWHQASGRGAVERQGELTLSGARESRGWMVQTHQPPAAAQADTVREALPAVTSAREVHALLSQSRYGASPPQRLGRSTYADPTGVVGVPRHPRHTPAEEKRQRPPSAGPVSGHNRQIHTARARDSDEMASGASPFIAAELDSSQNTSEHVDSDHSAGQPPPPPPPAAAAAAVQEELTGHRGQLTHPLLEMYATADSPLPPPQPSAASTTALAAKDLLQLMRPRDTSSSLVRHTPRMAQSTSVATAASTSTAGSQLPPRPPLLPSSSSAAATATTTPRSRSADYEVTVLSGGGRAGAGAAGTEPASAAHRHRGEAVGSSSAASSVRCVAGGAVHSSASTQEEQQQEEEKEEGKKGEGRGSLFHPAPFSTGPPGGGVAPPLSSSLSAHGSCVSHPEPLPSSVEETGEEWESVESGCESATTSSRYSEEEV